MEIKGETDREIQKQNEAEAEVEWRERDKPQKMQYMLHSVQQF